MDTHVTRIEWQEAHIASNTRRRLVMRFYPYDPNAPFVCLNWMPNKKLWRLTVRTYTVLRGRNAYGKDITLAEYPAPTTEDEAKRLAEAHYWLKGVTE